MQIYPAAIVNKTYSKTFWVVPDFNHQTIEPQMRAYVEQSGFSANQVFGILRVAITGQKVSPPLFESIEVIGKDKTLERLKKAMEMLEKFDNIQTPTGLGRPKSAIFCLLATYSFLFLPKYPLVKQSN